jgi:hypothetical protein
MPDLPPGQRPPQDRIARYCDTCQQVDTHPRHVHLGNDGTLVQKHFDCCHGDGCPDSSCAHLLDGSAGARGDGLVAWLGERQAGPGGVHGWLAARGWSHEQRR